MRPRLPRRGHFFTVSLLAGAREPPSGVYTQAGLFPFWLSTILCLHEQMTWEGRMRAHTHIPARVPPSHETK